MDENKKKRNIILTVVLVTGIIAVTVAAVILMSLMQRQEKSAKSYLAANTVVSEVVKKMNYQNLSKISDENVSKYYNIPQGVVTDTAVYLSNRADIGIELACFRLSSEESEEALYSAVSEYLSSKNTANKEGSGQLSKAKTDTVYPYVFVAVASDSDTAVSAFREIVGN